MDEAVQRAARRQDLLRPGERVLFLHTGVLPSLFAYQPVVPGDPAAAGAP